MRAHSIPDRHYGAKYRTAQFRLERYPDSGTVNIAYAVYQKFNRIGILRNAAEFDFYRFVNSAWCNRLWPRMTSYELPVGK